MCLREFWQFVFIFTFLSHSVSGFFFFKSFRGFKFSQIDTPWEVSVQVHAWHFCGGSIISNKWVLTSATCTSGKIPKSLAVRVGSSEHSRGGKVVKVKRIIQHDKFLSPIHDFDFALLELSEKLIYTAKIEAIQLPNEYDSFQDGSPCFVSGWGMPKIPKLYKESSFVTVVPLVNQIHCERAYRNIHFITNRMICAGNENQGKIICRDDSGSPLVCTDPINRTMKLVGIVSWSEGCAEANYPHVYARVQAIQSWIRNKTIV